MSPTKQKVRGGLNVRAYPVLSRAIEEGVAYGWRHAHKHTDAPDDEAIRDHIVTAVLNEICEYFDFDSSE
jgi:hypothetical protein